MDNLKFYQIQNFNGCFAEVIDSSHETITPCIIFIIDASGSMSFIWPTLVENLNKLFVQYPKHRIICFSDKAVIYNEKQLPTNISVVGGGSTNTESGFVLAKQVITKERNRKETHFTVIFISDGIDNNRDTINDRLQQTIKNFDTKNIEFICVGISSSFPTNMSLILRNSLHTGRDTIPSIFKIDYTNDVSKVIDSLQEYVNISNPSLIKINSCLNPWDARKENNMIYPGSFIMTDIKCESSNIMTTNIFIKIISQWIRVLHHTSNVKEKASIAYNLANSMWNAMLKDDENIQHKRLTVNQRLNKQLRKENYEITTLLSELNRLSKGELLDNLNDDEKAQRLAIGSNTGKYHNRAVEWKGLDKDTFIKYKKEFIELVKKIKDIELPDDERSIISLDSLKDIIKQEDIIEAIEACPSQYHWVECCPLIGMATHIRFTDGLGINPWLYRVDNVMKVHTYLDTVSMIGSENRELKLQNEVSNSVVPVYPEEFVDVKEIQDLIRSPLYQLLCTYAIMGNVDILDTEAHIAGLAGLYYYWRGQDPSTLRIDNLKRILYNVNVLYANKYNKYIDLMEKEPWKAMVTESPNIEVKCPSLSKAVLFMGVLQFQRKNISERTLYKAYIGRYVNSRNIEDWFHLGPDLSIPTTRYEDLHIEPKNFYYFDLLRKYIMNAEINIVKFDTTVYIKDIKLDKCIARICDSWIKEEYHFQCVYNACKYSNSYDMMNPDNFVDYQKAYSAVHEYLVNRNINKIKEDLRNKFITRAEKEYNEWFLLTHDEVPLPIFDNIKSDKYNPESGMYHDRCMVKSCPFYMVESDNLNMHLLPWEINHSNQIAFHKTIKKYRHLEVEEILQKCLYEPDSINNVKNKQETIDYTLKFKNRYIKEIERIRSAYIKQFN